MKKFIFCISLICFFQFLNSFAIAQDNEGPQFIFVRSVTTHLEGTGTWMEQQEEMAEALQENGFPTRHIWQEVFGDIDTFHVVSFHQSLGDFADATPEQPMSERNLNRWLSTTSPTIQSRETNVWAYEPELAIPGNLDYEYMVLRYVTIAVGQNGAFRTWLQEKYVPALKSLDEAGWGVSQMRHGDSNRVWLLTHRIESPASLDGPPPVFTLDPEEREALFEGTEGMIVRSETRVVRYLANLSHTLEE